MVDFYYDTSMQYCYHGMRIEIKTALDGNTIGIGSEENFVSECDELVPNSHLVFHTTQFFLHLYIYEMLRLYWFEYQSTRMYII